MAKPILFYALARGFGFSRFGGHGFQLLGVTSEKGGQVYGRDDRDHVTHVSARDVLHRFPADTPVEFCQGASVRAEAAQKAHQPRITELRQELSEAESAQRNAVLRAAKGLPEKS